MIENKTFVCFFIGCKLGRYISQLDLTTLEAEIINTLLSESKNIEKQYNVKILIESLGNGINYHPYQSLISSCTSSDKRTVLRQFEGGPHFAIQWECSGSASKYFL